MGNATSGDLLQMPCGVCSGTGSTSCSGCGGAGGMFISKSRLRFDRTLEFYQERQPCMVCYGTGRSMCLSCKGVGWTLQHRATTAPSRRRRVAVEAPAPQAPSEPFAFTSFEPVRHPGRPDVWAFWQQDPGNCLDYGDSGARIFLSGCTRDTWLYLLDRSGNRFPLEIFISSDGGLVGRWM